MKKILLPLAFLLVLSSLSKAQECDIEIQILQDKYMFGKAEKLQAGDPVKKMQVTFSSDFMEVVMPAKDGNYLIKVVNENCQAYCSRAKRVRQLHSGDEKLVRNLFKEKQDDILSQIKSCDG